MSDRSLFWNITPPQAGILTRLFALSSFQFLRQIVHFHQPEGIYVFVLGQYATKFGYVYTDLNRAEIYFD